MLEKRKKKNNKPAKIQTISPHILFKFFIINNAISDLSKLIYNKLTLLSNTEPSYLNKFQTIFNKNKISLTKDDALFSTFLRSRSPSCCLNKKNVKKTAVLETLLDTKISVSKIADFNCIQFIEQDKIKSPENPPGAKKPRFILRVRPLKTKTKFKKMPRPK